MLLSDVTSIIEKKYISSQFFDFCINNSSEQPEESVKRISRIKTDMQKESRIFVSRQNRLYCNAVKRKLVLINGVSGVVVVLMSVVCRSGQVHRSHSHFTGIKKRLAPRGNKATIGSVRLSRETANAKLYEPKGEGDARHIARETIEVGKTRESGCAKGRKKAQFQGRGANASRLLNGTNRLLCVVCFANPFSFKGHRTSFKLPSHTAFVFMNQSEKPFKMLENYRS